MWFHGKLRARFYGKLDVYGKLCILFHGECARFHGKLCIKVHGKSCHSMVSYIPDSLVTVAGSMESYITFID